MPRFVDAFKNTLSKATGTTKAPTEAKARERSLSPVGKLSQKTGGRDGERQSGVSIERDPESKREREERERERDRKEEVQDSENSEYDSEEDPVMDTQSALRTFQRADFQVGGMIGQGSFATVHKAKQLATSRDVALKVVRPESELDFGTGPNGSTPAVSYRDVLKAMRQEVLLMEMIGIHPNIVEVLGTAEDCRVFVMERAASDLYTIVKQQERNLPFQLAKLWAGHLLQAVHFMHDHGVVHQDIKSSNVLIFSDRSAKICDFGLARRGKPVMQVDRELVTLWYRPPELLMGESTYSPKVDEWGVGCILLEMVIGSSPFKGKPDCICQCPQITHRNYNSDQLMKIFAVTGTPKERTLLARQACFVHFNKWPVFPRKLESTVKRMCTSERLWRGKGSMPTEEETLERAEAWIIAIGGLLDLDCKLRLSAARVLDSPLFTSRHNAPASDTAAPQRAPSSGSGAAATPAAAAAEAAASGGEMGAATRRGSEGRAASGGAGGSGG